jgi:hypothetical protein
MHWPARPIGALAALAAALGLGASPAGADCCMGGGGARADFHARAASGGAVALLPVTTVEVSSEAPAQFTARIEIRVGDRVVARATRHGHSTTQWSRLRVALSTRQRHAISAAARHEGRRAVFGIQLRGTLEGHAQPSVHYVNLVMSGPGMPQPTELPDVGADQRTRVSLARQLVEGAPQRLRGRIVVRTPQATFTRTKRDASQSARFTVALAGDCRAQVLVFGGATASRLSAAALLDAPLAGSRRLAAGRAAAGSPWAIGAFAVGDEDGNPTGAYRLTGVRIARLAPRRWLRLTEYASLGAACRPADVAQPSFVRALSRVLALARFEAQLVRGVR